MRLKHEENITIMTGYDPEYFFSIYRPHDYAPRWDRHFCIICSHSLEYHIENDISGEQMTSLKIKHSNNSNGNNGKKEI